MKTKNESGQLVIVAVFVVIALIMSIVVVVFLNQTQSQFGVANQKRQKAHNLTQAGLSYAILTLAASSTTWTNALNASFPLEFTDPGGTPHQYAPPGGAGEYYTIQCSTGGALAKYQLQILVTGYTRVHGTMVPLRALSAVVSQKTLGATLPNGLNASAATVLAHPPNGPVDINWGPVMVLDPTNTWTVTDPMDSGQYPRKFAQAGIGGTVHLRSQSSPAVNSDNLEYWAYSSLGYPSEIDLPSYQTAARNTTLTTPPVAKNVAANLQLDCPVPGVPNCASFVLLNGDTAQFNNYTLNQPGTIIYINGNAELDTIAIDLKGDTQSSVFPSSGALIVTGDVLIANSSSGMSLTHLRIPPTANLEYPFSTSPTTYTQEPSFRGFLYTTGSLTNNVQDATLIGAVRVGNVLSASQALHLYYDDEIGHSILADHFELQVDSQTEVSAH
jgi:hypothetical protein